MDAAFEPFVERSPANFAEQPDGLFVIGYRLRGTNDTLASFVVPRAALSKALASEFELSARITTSGKLVCSLGDRADGTVTKVADGIAIESLVSALLAPENLYREEIRATELTALLVQLERSLALVRAALR